MRWGPVTLLFMSVMTTPALAEEIRLSCRLDYVRAADGTVTKHENVREAYVFRDDGNSTVPFLCSGETKETKITPDRVTFYCLTRLPTSKKDERGNTLWMTIHKEVVADRTTGKMDYRLRTEEGDILGPETLSAYMCERAERQF